MKFSAGNQLWRQRTKHGRDKIFTTPALLWEAACEYFQWCDENPRYEAQQTSGKGSPTKEKKINDLTGEEEEVYNFTSEAITYVPLKRAYGMDQLCYFLQVDVSYFLTFEKQLRKEDPFYADFIRVIALIRQVIRGEQIEGALTGEYKENLVSRLNSIADTSKNEHTGKDGEPLIAPSPLDTMTKEELLKLKYGQFGEDSLTG